MTCSKPKDQSERFIHTARKLGCDPDDPRIKDVLKGMAAQGPKPHADEPKTGAKPKKRES